MIYLDNAASTEADRRVIEAMIPYLGGRYGNPSSIHRLGRISARAVRRARMEIAALVNAEPSEILITSGGTESNNTALCGVPRPPGGGHVITSSVEHDAVLEPCRRLEGQGARVTYLHVDGHGMVDPGELRSAITPDTFLVSVMLANNEVGTVQPVREISGICSERSVPLHTDAVQAVGKMPVDVRELGVDMLSISSHKINGPKGVGALFVRSGVRLDPLVLGGGQERGMRSGTENVAGAVGFGEACRLCRENLAPSLARYRGLHRELVSGILSGIPLSALNGHPTERIPSNAHFTFLGVGGEDLIIKLDEYGVEASTGSACSVNTQQESHVLRAMGLSRDQIAGSLRLTLGTHSTAEEVGRAVGIVKRAVAELREFSPLREKYGF